MATEVRYYCPHCETVVSLIRDGYLADKSVTPYPLEGWTYVAPDEDFEDGDVDGVRFECGESPNADWAGDGCGDAFYLNFVRYEDGLEVEREPETETVTLADPNTPSRPRSPEGPGGPGGPRGPDGPRGP